MGSWQQGCGTAWPSRDLVLPMRKGSEDRVELCLAAKENVGEIYFCLTLSIIQDNDLPS